MNLKSLARIYEHDGPFVSIYLDTTSNVEDAGRRLEVRWKNVLRELEDLGVDEDTREALTAHRADHTRGNTRVLIASHGQVHLAVSLPEPPPTDFVRLSALPHLRPLVERAAVLVPHVVVLADRVGADILAYVEGRDPVEATSVDGEQQWITKVHAGGWSERRFQARAELGWEHNAKEVAEQVSRIAEDAGAQVIAVAGDVRAVSLLEQYLDEKYRPLFVKIPGGRSEDGSAESVGQHVLEVISERQTKNTIDLLAMFAEARATGDRATDGRDDTVVALTRAQVGTLLLSEVFEDDEPAFFGPEPTMLSRNPQVLRDMGVDQPQEAALGDVVLRAALGTDAVVRLVPAGLDESPRDGIGALLRFSLES